MELTREYLLENRHLYVVTRRDLSNGYQGVQSLHAALEFAIQYPTITASWNTHSNYLAFLSVDNEEELEMLFERALSERIPVVDFREPDIGNQLTAIAISPGAVSKEITAPLSLALS